MHEEERQHFGEHADVRHFRRALRLSSSALVFSLLASSGTRAEEPTPLPEVDVIAPAPLAAPHKPAPKRTQPVRTTSSQPAPAQPAAAPAAADSGGISRDKVPSNTQVLTSQDFSHTQSSNVLDALAKNLPGASLSDQSGNPFQRNLD
jgi:iron complex outermembrane receptor protein